MGDRSVRNPRVVDLRDESATQGFAQTVAQRLVWPMTIALNGGLGTGKTFFVRAVCQTLGIPPEEVTSPTYVLVQRYNSRVGPIYHLDFYRLNRVEEVWDLGVDELYEGRNLVFVEWAEKFPETLPADRLTIDFSEDAGRRSAMLSASGPRSRGVLEEWLGLLPNQD